MNFLPPTQNARSTCLGPQNNVMCLISWERTHRGDPHNLLGPLQGSFGPFGPEIPKSRKKVAFWGKFGGQKGASQTGHCGPQNFILLFLSRPYKCRFGVALQPSTSTGRMSGVLCFQNGQFGCISSTPPPTYRCNDDSPELLYAMADPPITQNSSFPNVSS